MQKFLRKFRRAVFDSDPSFCDMYEDAHANTAAQEYLGHIRRYLAEQFGQRSLTILDAGCQAGRLLIPLAEDGHTLIGIDTSAFALRRAARHAKENKLSVTLHTGNIGHVRRWVKPASLDVVICAEVLYLCRNYPELLALLADSLKPGGVILVSYRPTVFYATKATEQGNTELARTIIATQEGPSTDGAYHNWHTEEQLKALYASLGLQWLGCHPVDHAEILASQVPQYYLVAARKP